MKTPTSREWLRAAAQRIATGSERITSHHIKRAVTWVRDTWARTMAWLSDASGIAWAVRLCVLLAAAWILRKVGLGVAGWGARRVQASSGLLWAVLALWLIAAWRVGHPDWRPRPAPAAAEAPEPEAEPEPVSLAKEHPAGPSLDDVLVTAITMGTPHIHLTAIEHHLGAPQGSVRRVLTEAGIPITDVRMKGRGTSTGVRGDDIPAPASPSQAATDDADGAGQDDNNSNNGGNKPPYREGMSIIPDPQRPGRWMVAHHYAEGSS